MVAAAHVKAATKASKYGNVKKAKMGAVAFSKKGETIATAYNRNIYGHSRKFSIHAEAALLQKLEKIKAFDRYNNIIILVLRIRKNGQMSMAKPCSQCQNLLNQYNIKVIYTHWSGDMMEM